MKNVMHKDTEFDLKNSLHYDSGKRRKAKEEKK
jgi:hypothetical protein